MKVKNLFLFLMINFFVLNGYEGDIAPLSNLISMKSYHFLKNGKEASILDIKGIPDFLNNILNNKKPVVCLLYSSISESSGPQISFMEWSSNNKNIKENVDIAFIDIASKSNKELINKLTDIFVQCVLQLNLMQTGSIDNSEIKIRVSNMLKNIMMSKDDLKNIKPMLIFFKESNLMIPRKDIYLNIDEFLKDIKEQLLNNIIIENSSNPITSNIENKALEQSSWNRFKKFFKGLLSK